MDDQLFELAELKVTLPRLAVEMIERERRRRGMSLEMLVASGCLRELFCTGACPELARRPPIAP